MPRSSRLETHDHSTCGFMAWCRKSGAQVAGKLENSTAIVAADGEKSARIDLKVLPAFDKCPNEGKDEQLRSLLLKAARCALPGSEALLKGEAACLSSSGAVPSVGGSCFVAGAGRRRRFIALRPRARV